MKQSIIMAVALLALAVPTWAASLACDTSLVTCGVCRTATTQQVLFYDAPNAQFARLRDAIVAQENYQSQVTCATDRQFQALLNGADSRIVSAAGVTEGDCLAGEIGQAVANPQSQGDFADAVIHRDLRNRVIRFENQEAVDAADDLSAVATPDLGQ